MQSLPEIWGGIECTVNRVNDRYIDQFKQANFDQLEEIFDKIGSLGIKKIRFPILWETHEPTEEHLIDFSKTGSYLDKLRSLGISPIAGLVHHGSGPAFTDLLDEAFPEKLAAFAEKVAKEFPWIEYYTPVNEPLTTARFSGLYGFWYPHHRSDESFLRILLNEVKAIVLSMRAIRKINPAAKLIQTEDLGKTYSTPLLAYQANFENKRRWLTYDLLCGKVNVDHDLFRYFLNAGITEDELKFFEENPCYPDVAGFNYYVTSERYLDEKLHLYPGCLHGGNHFHRYVDTEAVRVNHGFETGVDILLKEAYQRLNLPIALTEIHINCTREEQMRWFHQIFEKCKALLEEGIEIKAITYWSLLGAYGWNKLLTCDNQLDYEAGAFELFQGKVRETAIAKAIRKINNNQEQHPLIHLEGWWERNIRFFDDFEKEKQFHQPNKTKSVAPVLIIGKRGTLGNAFAMICDLRNIPYRLLSRDELNMCDPASVDRAINKYKPWAVINAAGFVRVDDAENEVAKCFEDNTRGPVNLGIACQQYGIQLMSFSSDLVFDGTRQQPYFESDAVNPLNVYGQSKAEKEKLLSEINPGALVIRTSAFFGPWDQYNFAFDVIRQIQDGNGYHAIEDIIVSPTYVPDLVNRSLDLLIDEESHIWHIANDGQVSWYDWAKEIAARAGMNTNNISPLRAADMNWPAARPAYSVLKSEKGLSLPSLENAMDRFMNERSEVRIAMAG